jgi:hypothetical protein
LFGFSPSSTLILSFVTFIEVKFYSGLPVLSIKVLSFLTVSGFYLTSACFLALSFFLKYIIPTTDPTSTIEKTITRVIHNYHELSVEELDSSKVPLLVVVVAAIGSAVGSAPTPSKTMISYSSIATDSVLSRAVSMFIILSKNPSLGLKILYLIVILKSKK